MSICIPLMSDKRYILKSLILLSFMNVKTGKNGVLFTTFDQGLRVSFLKQQLC